MGENLEPVVLFYDAKPGDKVLITVKLLETANPKWVNGSMVKIDFAENRPSHQDMRDELLSAHLLVPADTATLNNAIGEVDLTAFDAGKQPEFDASLKASGRLSKP
jgi:alpha-mannosidase